MAVMAELTTTESTCSLPSVRSFPTRAVREKRQEAEDTPKTMSFMHLHLGIEGALPAATDVRDRGAVYFDSAILTQYAVELVGYALLGFQPVSVDVCAVYVRVYVCMYM